MSDETFDRDGFYRQVGERMRLLRNRAGLTQQEVADALEIPRSTYANIERARQRAPADVLWRLAIVTGYPVGELLPDPVERWTPLPEGSIDAAIISGVEGSPSDMRYSGTAPSRLPLAD